MEKGDDAVGVAPATHVEHLEDTKQAQQANAAEHQATFRQAFSESRKAVFWSAMISLTIIMEGYDVGE